MRRMTSAVVPVVVAALGVASCTSTPTPALATSVSSSAPDPYEPGLGEIMSLQQMRHTKLWLAGQAKNWALADYEIKELGEGFDDVVKWHPTHEDSPVAPKDLLPRIVTEPLAALHQSVVEQNPKAFAQVYDALTTACNSCHDAMKFGFNRVQQPATNPYPNQVFDPAR